MGQQAQRPPPTLPDQQAPLPLPLASHTRRNYHTGYRGRGRAFALRPPPHRLPMQLSRHLQAGPPLPIVPPPHHLPPQSHPQPPYILHHPSPHSDPHRIRPPPPHISYHLPSPSDPPASAPQLSPEELATKPRPHPHLPGNILYISHVPGNLPEDGLAKIMVDCLPVKIKLGLVVPQELQSHPGAYADWMPKSGTLEFEDTYHVEKAMATLSSHPLLAAHGTIVSLYPPPLPLPFGESWGRYLRPTQWSAGYGPTMEPVADVMASCPSPAELFDLVRGWGSIRVMNMWTEPLEGSTIWAAQIEFWYEDEARRFEIGFGQQAGHVRGWQVKIISEAPSLQPTMPFPFQPVGPPLHPIPGYMPQAIPGAHVFGPNQSASSAPAQLMPAPAIPFPQPLLGASSTESGLRPGLPSPQTPPLDLPPAWSGHTPYMPGAMGMTHIPVGPIQMPFPLSPPIGSFRLPTAPSTPIRGDEGFRPRQGHRGSLSRASMSSLRSSTGRKWSVTLDQGPDGEMRPTGLIADDGLIIQHVPGQHIRPAPPFGPGSTSLSGLVDYSNVFVKNLNVDIDSEYLAQLFSSVGRIVSARVMRDHMNRSRGYGFVSFNTPEEAALAIQQLDGAKVAGQTIAVTLHEPKRLRPEKLMEKAVVAAPTAYGRPKRRSSSPRSSVRGRQTVDEIKPVATTDQIRSLSPASRKIALIDRVTPVVQRYLKVHKMSEAYCGPAAMALANQDLALIPALHNHILFTNRIAEVVTELQEDHAVEEHLHDDVETAGPLTQSQIELLRIGMEMIDPVDVDEVLQVIISSLSAAEVDHIIKDRALFASQYEDAKRKLESMRHTLTPPELDVPAQAVPLPPSDASTMVAEDAESDGFASEATSPLLNEGVELTFDLDDPKTMTPKPSRKDSTVES